MQPPLTSVEVNPSLEVSEVPSGMNLPLRWKYFREITECVVFSPFFLKKKERQMR